MAMFRVRPPPDEKPAEVLVTDRSTVWRECRPSNVQIRPSTGV